MRAILLTILTLGLVCGGCQEQPEPPPEPVHVLTTVQALADIAKTIGGEFVSVKWYVESGQSLDELTETPERRGLYRQADLVVTRGIADRWTLEGYGNTYQDRKIIRMDTMVSARGNDPNHYLWLDPEVALELANVLAARLSTLEPRGSSTYQSNVDKFRAAVAEAMQQATSSIVPRGRGAFLTLDRGFLPLANRFGLREVRAPAISLIEPTAYNVRALQQAARDAGAGAVFAGSDTPAPLLRDWESRLGMPVLGLDALGTSSPTGRSTYLAMLRHNLEQLAAGVARNTPTTYPEIGEQTGEVKALYPRAPQTVELETRSPEGTLLRQPAVVPSMPFTPSAGGGPKVDLPRPDPPATRPTGEFEYRRDRSVSPSNPFAPPR